MVKKLGLLVCCSMALLVGHVEANSRDVNLERESQTFATANKVAIVVGVNNYDAQSGLRALKYAVPDANLIKTALEKQGYVVRLLTNRQANSNYILDAIEQAGQLLEPNQGTLTFFFSGHGFGDPRSGVNYLATSNTLSRNLKGSALSLQQVEQAIRRTRVKRAIMFVDACRDNPFIGKSVAQPTFLQQHGQGIKALYATEFGQLSYETPALGHGVFSHFLYRGLMGHAVEKDGVVSYDSLKRYVQNETANWTFKHFGQPQKPFSRDRTDSFGVFVLGYAGGNPQSVRRPPVQAPQSRPQQPQRQPAPVVRPQPQLSTARKSFEPDMVTILAGSFMMGCVIGRDDVQPCNNNEKPAHQVQLPAFRIARHEVSFNEWDVCERAKACPHADDNGWGRGDLPVINVSWNDTQKYLQWLGSNTGKRYRLPTGAEWEYAARGGRKGDYPWGKGISCGDANYYGCGANKTKPVTSYAANGFGLKNMSGNVQEWVGDWYGSYVSSPVSNPKGADSGSTRVLRGGSWFENPQRLRSAYRFNGSPVIRNSSIGFRLAQDLR